jgi:hypothetical protein
MGGFNMIGPGNANLINNIGEKSDLVDVPYLADSETILAYLQTGYYHVHGASFVYPYLEAPVLLTSAAPSWDITGDKIEIIPADALGKNFDLHWCSISAISATLDGIIDFFAGLAGSEVKIGAVDVVRTTTFSRENPVPVQVAQQPANTRISARFTDNTTAQRSARIKLYGHVYATQL